MDAEEMTDFIFMLTRHDVTIPNAIEVFEKVKNSGLKFVGCKDIGLPVEKLEQLFHRMKKKKVMTFLEVVSGDEEKHFEGIEKAIRIGSDYIIGGMPRFAEKTRKYLKKRKASLKFFPYIGEVVDHPCILKGSVNEIIREGLKFEKMGFEGINLLLYRYTGDITLLLEQAVAMLSIPLIVAGNIDSFAKIDHMKEKGIFAFTVGGAVFEKRFVPGKSVEEQVRSILGRVG